MPGPFHMTKDGSHRPEVASPAGLISVYVNWRHNLMLRFNSKIKKSFACTALGLKCLESLL